MSTVQSDFKQGMMCTNGYRKFAITPMKKANLDFGDREYLVGHKHSRGLDVNYDRSSEENRLTEWSKTIDYLTIDQTFRFKKNLQKVEGAQQQEIVRLKAEILVFQEFARKAAAEINDIPSIHSGLPEIFSELYP